ncbi:hypothetical protein NMG60_11029298 [Bertholletia excelsa]
MTRKKVTLSYIAHESTRKSTFKKRKRGLLKKVLELSTLCGVEACVIIFNPQGGEPDVWPSHLGVQRVIARFRNMPDMDQNKKMENQETFTRHRLSKVEDQLRRHQKENRGKELSHAMYQCMAGVARLELMGLADLIDLGRLVDQNLREVALKLNFFMNKMLNQDMVDPDTNEVEYQVPNSVKIGVEAEVEEPGKFNESLLEEQVASQMMVLAAAAAMVPTLQSLPPVVPPPPLPLPPPPPPTVPPPPPSPLMAPVVLSPPPVVLPPPPPMAPVVLPLPPTVAPEVPPSPPPMPPMVPPLSPLLLEMPAVPPMEFDNDDTISPFGYYGDEFEPDFIYP